MQDSLLNQIEIIFLDIVLLTVPFRKEVASPLIAYAWQIGCLKLEIVSVHFVGQENVCEVPFGKCNPCFKVNCS